MTTHLLLPGDGLLTRTPNSVATWAIRFGAALLDRPNLVNHVAVYLHDDANGVPWGMEGRPGGFGQVDLRPYLASRWTVCNRLQPKTTLQRAAVVAGAKPMAGWGYDWEAIAADTAEALHIDWSPRWHGQVPGHVVCSSALAYLYDGAHLSRPHRADDGGGREITPADWDQYWVLHGYDAHPCH